MALHQYIGARYVPKFYENSLGTAEWQSGVIYEPLTIVTYNLNSYTSKKTVPANIGDPSNNPDYWVATGVFNAQIAALQNDVDALQVATAGLNADPINVLTLGVKNDGSEDCSAIINQYTLTNDLYFPCGTYRADSPIILRNSICGPEILGRSYPAGAVIQSNVTSGAAVVIDESATSKTISIANITIDCNNNAIKGIDFRPSIRVQLNLSYVVVIACVTALNIAPTISYPQSVKVRNFCAFGMNDSAHESDIFNSVGIEINANAADCTFTDITIFGYRVGFRSAGGGQFISLATIYPENGYVIVDKKTYFAGTCCIDASADIVVDTAYLDSSYQIIVQRAGIGTYGKIFSWYDSWMSDVSDLNAGIMFSTRNNGQMVVENFIYGGTPNCQVYIAAGNTAILNFKSKITFTTAAARSGMFMPMGYYYRKRSMSYTYSATGPYFEIGRVNASSYGDVKFRFTLNQDYADFDVRLSGAGAVSALTKTGSLSNSFYYKIDGNYVIIYMNNNSYTNLVMRNEVISVAGPVHVGFMDPLDYGYTPLSQNDATGLTAVA